MAAPGFVPPGVQVAPDPDPPNLDTPSFATDVFTILQYHPANYVDNPKIPTGTNKPWAKDYHPIENLIVHTWLDPMDGLIKANFDPLLPFDEDDDKRSEAPSVTPNKRVWRFESEADCELWFHTEISNTVLAGWGKYPQVTQSSHNKPPTAESIKKEVDSTYTIKWAPGERGVIAIGEMKRATLRDSDEWQNGRLTSSGQILLSQELRGYAVKYNCPQVFCFDGELLVMLQFRADRPEDMRAANCPVDCWVLPRDPTRSRVTFRLLLYRLLLQGFRRFQTRFAFDNLSVGGYTPRRRRFFDGLPIWRVGGVEYMDHPGGYQRKVHKETGAIGWIFTHENGYEEVVWETDVMPGTTWGEQVPGEHPEG